MIDYETAVFTDLTYKVAPSFTLTAGARYYELRDSIENQQAGALAAPDQPLVHANASGTSPRIVLSYHATEDAMVYAMAGRGYRPGGPNVGLPAGFGCTLNHADSPLYRPDSVWNFEIGAKSEFFMRRLAVNMAVYRIDWRDVQQTVTDPGCGYSFVANVGTAQSNGVEVEINYKPTDSLLLNASGSYTRAEFRSIDGPFQGAAAVRPGDSAPDIPRQKITLGGDFTRKAIADIIGYFHCDWHHLGSVPTGFSFSAVRPAYSALDAALGLRTHYWDFSVYGHNLTNTTGILAISQSTTQSFSHVFRSQIATPPRSVGIDLKMHF